VAHSFEIKAEITGGVGQPVQPMLWNWGHRLQRLIELMIPEGTSIYSIFFSAGTTFPQAHNLNDAHSGELRPCQHLS